MRLSTFFIIPISILLAGCSPTLSPTIQEYTIYPDNTTPLPVLIHSNKTLRLSTTKTILSLSSKNIYYFHSRGKSGSYLYSRWSDNPAQLIERYLIASLEEHRMFNSLIPPTSSAQADWILESDLHAFYHRFISDTKSQGVIDITYRIIDIKTNHLISSQRFLITTPAPSNDASGAISALSQGTKTLIEECSFWISDSLKKVPNSQ